LGFFSVLWRSSGGFTGALAVVFGLEKAWERSLRFISVEEGQQPFKVTFLPLTFP
jgi:hypothetical protein